MSKPENRICVGVVTGSFGVRGEARIKSFCAIASDIGNYGDLWNESGTNSHKIKILRAVKGGFAARIGGIDTKEQADENRGLKLFADRDALPSLPDDEYYYTDLIGLDVYDTGGEKLGKINEIHNHGAGDLLEISGPAIKGSTLLPFNAATIPTVDLATGRVIADPPAGVFDDD
jgi:16S rRNA processing protein RimM